MESQKLQMQKAMADQLQQAREKVWFCDNIDFRLVSMYTVVPRRAYKEIYDIAMTHGHIMNSNGSEISLP